MERLQSKEDNAQSSVEEAPDPEDLAAQVCYCYSYCQHLYSLHFSGAGEMPEWTWAAKACLRSCGLEVHFTTMQQGVGPVSD